MSKENVRLFYDTLAKDTDLQSGFKERSIRLTEELKGEVPGEERMEEVFREELLPVIREAGFDFSYADLKEYAEDASVGELADEELAAVAAGADLCVCVVAGFGDFNSATFTCVVGGAIEAPGFICGCVLGGGGGTT